MLRIRSAAPIAAVFLVATITAARPARSALTPARCARTLSLKTDGERENCAAALAGTIEGRVTLSRMAPQRVANRYPGEGSGASHRAGAVPAVAYIVGPVAGARDERGARPTLVQQDTAFHPPALVIPVGTSVDFPNHDPFFHNVFSYSATKRFDLGRYPRGESRTVTFERPGIVKVYCEIHQWMRSAIIVAENPYHAEVGADGRFTITGVPAGRYRLAVWDFDRGQRVVDVTVPAGGNARVDVSL